MDRTRNYIENRERYIDEAKTGNPGWQQNRDLREWITALEADRDKSKKELEIKQAQHAEAAQNVAAAQAALDNAKARPLSTANMTPVPLPATLPVVYDKNEFEANGSGDNKELSIPRVETIAAAIKIVLEMTNKAIAANEQQILTENVMAGFANENYKSNGAYVYQDDQQKHIHLGNQFLRNRQINNHAPLVSSKNEENPPFSRTVMTHELSHFNDIGGLHDLFIRNDKGKILGPYGAEPCQKLAEAHPCAALKNADNFTRFINHDVTVQDIDHYDYY